MALTDKEFSQEIERIWPKLRRWANIFENKNPLVAGEDLLQDTSEKAWKKRKQFNPESAALSTWCYRIMHTTCIDHLRHHQVKKKYLGERLQTTDKSPNGKTIDIMNRLPSPDPTTEEKIAYAETFNQISSVSETLPPRKQMVLQAALEGQSVEEISEKQGITPTQVYKNMYHCRRAIFEGKGIGYLLNRNARSQKTIGRPSKKKESPASTSTAPASHAPM